MSEAFEASDISNTPAFASLPPMSSPEETLARAKIPHPACVSVAIVSYFQQRDIGGGSVSLHWPEIDEDLSVANLLAGADWQAA